MWEFQFCAFKFKYFYATVKNSDSKLYFLYLFISKSMEKMLRNSKLQHLKQIPDEMVYHSVYKAILQATKKI